MGNRLPITYRRLGLIAVLVVLFVGGPLVYLTWSLHKDVQKSHNRVFPSRRDVQLFGFASEDAAVRASVQRLSQELRQYTQPLFIIRWKLNKRGDGTAGLIYSRDTKVLGSAIDADSGPSISWTNVTEADIHALAKKRGVPQDLGPGH